MRPKRRAEEQKGAKNEETVSNDKTNLEKENRSEEGKDKSDNDQKKKSKSSGKLRKKYTIHVKNDERYCWTFATSLLE